MTQCTEKKNWAQVPLYIMIFCSPQPFSPANIKCGKERKLKKWGGVFGTIETYTKVPTPSGWIDKTKEIVKITSQLLFFPSEFSPFKIEMRVGYVLSIVWYLSFYASGGQA